ncbi:MAG: restriction endonuclease subunit S [Eubacterium sp.]|nr:restriction endonuclease subunit S [Eubacterium sp.]
MAKPKLRFPEFTGEWEKTILEKKVHIYDGTHQTPKYVSKGVKFVSVENIHDIYNTDKFISEEAYDKYKIKPQKDDILMTRIAGIIGDTAMVSKNEPLAYYVSLALIRKKENINTVFLAYNINSNGFKHELHRRIIHVAFPKKINLGDIGKCEITFPKEKEQQKIADFLSSIDDIIKVQEEEISVFEEQKKGIMQKLFNREVRFKADDESEYPEWKEKKLFNIGAIITGTTPSTKNEKYYSDKYLWVTPADIEGKEISNSQKKLSEDGLKKGRIIPANSVLVTCIASIGKNAILREMGSCNQQINAITPNNEYNVDFLYYLLCFNENMLHANAGRGGMEILNKDQFSKLSMLFPCIEEQKKIADCLTAYDEVTQIKKGKLETWKEIKKGLLQQMFV